MARNEIQVWDPFIRIAHWVLVAAFTVAYVTEGEPEVLHVWAGYTVAAIVVLRVVWGFIGPRYARFSNFVRGPGAVLRNLSDIVRLRGRRYIGHSPAGGAMIVLLLLSLAATTLSGMVYLAEKENEGPLAPWLGQQASAPSGELADRSPVYGRAEDDEEEDEGGEIFEEVHEFFANLTLWLVILHIGGVILASFSHRENLVRAMITGRKMADAESGASRPWRPT